MRETTELKGINTERRNKLGNYLNKELQRLMY